MLGYFPTYALGNLVSAQLWEVIQQDLPTLRRKWNAASLANCSPGCAKRCTALAEI